jgi:ubiquinol-cytochrome c reductase cytochrome c1 subunit
VALFTVTIYKSLSLPAMLCSTYMPVQVEMEDGPNDEGEDFTRPGRLSDPLPRPYKNEEAARYANGGAYPPDLSLITKARHDGQNYVFSLLLGYRDPPAGVNVRPPLIIICMLPGLAELQM